MQNEKCKMKIQNAKRTKKYKMQNSQMEAAAACLVGLIPLFCSAIPFFFDILQCSVAYFCPVQ